MRTQITQDSHPHRCTIRYEDDLGNLVERDFFATVGGGYVREDRSNPRQVCEQLESRGVTLMWDPSQGPLSTLIRREWRARQRRAQVERSR